MGQAALFSIRFDEPSGKPGSPAGLPAELLLFRRAADSLEDAVAITAEPAESEPLVVLYANPAFAALSGLAPNTSDAPPTSPLLPQDDPLWSSLLESHRSDGGFLTDIILCRPSGRRTILRLRSQPIYDETGRFAHRVAVLRDITEQTDLEETLQRNERLACIGLLAAGIAHEINNPTGSALLAAETALAIMDSPQANQQVAACLRNIVTSMDRCGRIVRTLLRYTRDEPSERQACGINDVAEQALELARPYAERHGAELRLELDPDVPLAPMNPLEIELVLVNLIRNAVEAGGGNVVISIRTARTEEGVRLAVADNGCGMNQEQLAHVFDPLYTTRRQLGGSGLGMSIARGIIQRHHGRMEVLSQPGLGTTATIDLPVAGEKGTGEEP